MGKPRDGRPPGKSFKNKSKGDKSVKSIRKNKTDFPENSEDAGAMMERLDISEGEEVEDEEGKYQYLSDQCM